MSEATTERQKLEIGGMPLIVCGVTIRLVEVDRRAAFIEISVDPKPRFEKPSDVLLNRPA